MENWRGFGLIGSICLIISTFHCGDEMFFGYFYGSGLVSMIYAIGFWFFQSSYYQANTNFEGVSKNDE